jgi:hypothetical protein
LTDVLKEFNRSGIPVVPLKGPVLSFELYGDVGLRQSSDLDVVVAKEDLKKAQASLESLGWQLDPSFFRLSPRQWEAFLRHEQHMIFMHSQTHRGLELHWRNSWESPAATSAWWARSVFTNWQGISIRTMHPGDLALYLCRHGGQHAWSCAKWLGDVASAHSIALLDWSTAFDEARRESQQNILLSAMYLLDCVYELPLPEFPDDLCAESRSLLIDFPLQSLKDSEETPAQTGLSSLRRTFHLARYERRLSLRKTWRGILSKLFYCREDFGTLSLPDSFFWAYKPLRFVLWLRRGVRSRGKS